MRFPFEKKDGKILKQNKKRCHRQKKDNIVFYCIFSFFIYTKEKKFFLRQKLFVTNLAIPKV